MKRCVLLAFLFLITLNSQGSTLNTEINLLNKLQASQDPRKKAEINIELAFFMSGTNAEKARDYAYNALELIKGIKAPILAGEATRALAEVNLIKGDFDLAYSKYLSALSIFQEKNHEQGLFEAHGGLGATQFGLGNLKEAEKHFLESKKYLNAISDVRQQSSLLNALVRLYMHQKRFEEALAVCLETIDKLESNKEDWTYANALSNAGKIYLELEQGERAVSFLEQANQYAEQQPRLDVKLLIKLDLANALAKIGRINTAFIIADEASNMVEGFESSFYKSRTYYRLSELYSQSNNYEKALVNHRKAAALTRIILDEEKSKQIAELQTNYDFVQREAELKITQAEVEKQKQMTFGVSIFTVIFAALAYFAYRNYRLKEQANKELKLLATTDPMTGLNNRRHLMDEVGLVVAMCKRHSLPISVLICDIDKFKNINDSFGHTVGDKAIIGFAHLIQSCVREEDLLARWGGEEFVAVLANTDAKKASALAERIRTKTESLTINVDEKPITFTASFGLAQFDTGDTIEQVIGKSDSALYRAKELGRNRVETAAL